MAIWVAESYSRKKTVFKGEVRSTNKKAILKKAKDQLTKAAGKGKAKEGEYFKVSLFMRKDQPKPTDAWKMVARSA